MYPIIDKVSKKANNIFVIFTILCEKFLNLYECNLDTMKSHHTSTNAKV
jgi:hypothetical protein